MKVEPPNPVAWTILRAWVLCSAFINALGWSLALTGHLNAKGYAIGFLLGGALLFVWARQNIHRPFPRVRLFLTRRRWRWPLAQTFAAVFILVSTGAALYPPSNYDALTYRVPQILHWLAAGSWHWIPVSDQPINITPPGYGWCMAPMVALFHTDRLFALPNLIAFALLPGLYFSVLRQCGVGERVAWMWMWILPTASCFAMQAGGIGNDLLSAVYALAAVALGFRAAQRRDIRDFWLSAMAVALLTGVKITAAPLALPWLIVTLPCWKLIPTRWLSSLAMAALALFISYVPTAVGNTLHTGSWNGDPTNRLKVRVDSPVHGVVGNSLMILVGALEPPICPVAGTIKTKFQAFESTAFVAWLRQGYPRFDLSCGELPSEESSGLGLVVSALAVLPLITGWTRRKSGLGGSPDWGRWVGLASFIALGVYLAKMGSEAAPRLAAPFYPLALVPLLRTQIHEKLARRSWWRALALLVALSIVPGIVLTPARPLWPAQSVLAHLRAKKPSNALIARAQVVYQVYAQRDDDIAPLKPLLPSDGRAVGYVRAENDIEAPLWKPYGSREIVEMLPPTPDLSRLARSVVVGSAIGIDQKFAVTPEKFAVSLGGRIIGRAFIRVKASGELQEWVVIALGDSRGQDPSSP